MYCVDHPKNVGTVGFCFPRIPVDETMEEQNKRLQKEIETLRKEGFQLRLKYATNGKTEGLNDDDYIINNWERPKKSQKVKHGKDIISNVCMPDKIVPRVNLEGVTFNINDTSLNAPIIIGDYHNHPSDHNDVTDVMKSVKSPKNVSTYESKKLRLEKVQIIKRVMNLLLKRKLQRK